MTWHLTRNWTINPLPFCHIHSPLWAQLGIPLLSAMTKMISRVHSVTQVIMRHNQCSQPLLSTSSIVETAWIVATFILNVLNTFATIAYNMPQCTKYLIAHFVEVGDFNSSRGYCYELFFSSWSTCLCLTFFILLIRHVIACRSTWVFQHMFHMCLPCYKHVFNSCLSDVQHVFHTCLLCFLLLFKLVDI
jgi:hypothetical protein